MYVSGRSAHSFQIFQGDGPQRGHPQPRSVGAAQGHRARGHGRFHPSRLAGRAGTDARTGGRGTVPHPGRGAPARRLLVSGRAAFRRFGRDQLHLQAGRQGAQGAQRHPAAVARRRRTAGHEAGDRRQHPFGRAADPRAFLQRPARRHARRLPGRGLHPRAHLDAPFFAVRRLFGLRFDRRMLRRPVAAHSRAGNGALVRPADEPPRAHARRLYHGLRFGRPFSCQTRAGEQPHRRAALLSGAQTRVGDGGGLCGDGGIFSRRGEIPSGRAPQLSSEPDPAGDGALRRALPRVREKDHRRRSAPPRTARRAAGIVRARKREAVRTSHAPAGSDRRLAGRFRRWEPGGTGVHTVAAKTGHGGLHPARSAAFRPAPGGRRPDRRGRPAAARGPRDQVGRV